MSAADGRKGPYRLLTGGSLSAVNLRPSLKQAKSSRKKKEVPSEGTGEECVQEGIGAGVDGVEKDQQQFRV